MELSAPTATAIQRAAGGLRFSRGLGIAIDLDRQPHTTTQRNPAPHTKPSAAGLSPTAAQTAPGPGTAGSAPTAAAHRTPHSARGPAQPSAPTRPASCAIQAPEPHRRPGPRRPVRSPRRRLAAGRPLARSRRRCPPQQASNPGWRKRPEVRCRPSSLSVCRPARHRRWGTRLRLPRRPPTLFRTDAVTQSASSRAAVAARCAIVPTLNGCLSFAMDSMTCALPVA